MHVGALFEVNLSPLVASTMTTFKLLKEPISELSAATPSDLLQEEQLRPSPSPTSAPSLLRGCGPSTTRRLNRQVRLHLTPDPASTSADSQLWL